MSDDGPVAAFTAALLPSAPGLILYRLQREAGQLDNQEEIG